MLLLWISLGWAGVLVSLVLLARFWLHSFLAVTAPLNHADILVVEGWMDDDALKNALPIFERGSYKALVTIGGPLRIGTYISPYKTLAELSAATLIAFGGDRHAITAVPSSHSLRDRTAITADAFRDWITTHHPSIQAINLYCYGVHARRTWWLYRNVLSPDIQVGVIASVTTAYDPTRWWESSEGVKRILIECVALLYTLNSLCKRKTIHKNLEVP